MASPPPSLPGRFFRGRRRRQHGRPNLPLPVHAEAAHSAEIACLMSESFDVLEDVIQNSFSHLHRVQNMVDYWQSRAKATKSQKIYSMIFERGPRAFFMALHESWNILKSNGSLSEYFMQSQSDMVSSKLAALKNMQNSLASFVSQIYSQVADHREGLTENPSKSLRTVFLLLNKVFDELEASLTNACQGQTVPFPSTDEICFKRLPEGDVDSALTADAISLVYQNLQELNSFVSCQLSSFERPRKTTIYWLPYTFGAIGLCACSLWLLHHNSLMASCDMDSWIFRTKNSFSSFWDWHVEKPVISIQGEFMETYKRSDKRVMEPEEVQFYKASLHRMLLNYFDQTINVKVPADVPFQVLVEAFMIIFEKQWEFPMASTIFGHLPHAMFIKLQLSKLDLQESLLLFDQLLEENETPLALLAAAPGLLLLLLFLVGAWAMHVKQAKGSVMVTRRHQRQLLVYAREKLMGYQKCKESGMEEAGRCEFGLTLYTLDRLYKAVELRAQRTGEWSSVREEMFLLVNPGTGIARKMDVLSRLDKAYVFLSKPLPRPHL